MTMLRMLKTFRDVFSRFDSVHDDCDGRRRAEITASICVKYGSLWTSLQTSQLISGSLNALFSDVYR